jgi:iron complex outermembrane receptor protein
VQGDTAPTTFVDPNGGATRPVANAGEIFKPYASRQGEVGVKFDGGQIGGSLSAFYTAKPVATVNPLSTRYEVTDYQRNRGAELTFFGEAAPGLRVLGGASYLHAEVTGTRAIGSPRWQSNVGVEWDLPVVRAPTIDARVLATASQYADSANAQPVPAWWRLDVGSRYTFGVGAAKLTLRARIDNVTDRNSWVSVGGYPGSGYLVLGAPRTFVVSTTVGF